MCVANIGDSRAIIGERKGKRVIAYSLSIDQTPYRQDERERCKAAGAVVMSCDQLEGLVPFHENWGVNLGEELDNGATAAQRPGSLPGCAFTRSIGDSVAESIGVTAEPELLRKELTEEDQFLVLASDGVWEFLTNQSVADMILKFADPLDACRAVVAESYRLWLQYEVRTDDITMILAFIEYAKGAKPETYSDTGDSTENSMKKRRASRRESRRGSADAISLGLDVVGRAGGENRPVRRGLSKEKRQAMTIGSDAAAMAEDDDVDFKPEVVPKSKQEVERIRTAVRDNFLFQHLNERQQSMVFDVMQVTWVTPHIPPTSLPHLPHLTPLLRRDAARPRLGGRDGDPAGRRATGSASSTRAVHRHDQAGRQGGRDPPLHDGRRHQPAPPSLSPPTPSSRATCPPSPHPPPSPARHRCWRARAHVFGPRAAGEGGEGRRAVGDGRARSATS